MESVILLTLCWTKKQINMTAISLIKFNCLFHSQALLELLIIVQKKSLLQDTAEIHCLNNIQRKVLSNIFICLKSKSWWMLVLFTPINTWLPARIKWESYFHSASSSQLVMSRKKKVNGTVQENYLHMEYIDISGKKTPLNSVWFTLMVQGKELHLPWYGDQTWDVHLTQTKQKETSKQTK